MSGMSQLSDAATSRQPVVCAARHGGSGGKAASSSGSGSGPRQGAGGGKARANFGLFRPAAARRGSGMGGAASGFFGSLSTAVAAPLWPLTAPPGARRKRRGPKRVLVLMSDTGGGHRASAEALKAGFEETFGNEYRIDICDIWSLHTPWPFNQLPKSYSFMVKYGFIWRFSFTLSNPRFVHVPLTTAAAAVVGRRVSEALDHYQPDLVVSVHPLMQHVPVRILRQRIAHGMQDPINFATVVTDLTTCHNTWFYPLVDRCYVATEESRRQALSLGLAPAQIRMFGLPIRPDFSRSFPSKQWLRKELGMLTDKPAVLLVGGGEGMGPVEKTVDSVAKEIGADCQLVVVCGRNQRLVDRLSAKAYPPGMHVLIKGFVTNMAELMSASDVIITKAGPGTISEALICGLPMVLNAFVPCQEESNIPYVTENKVGVFESRPDRVARVIKGWLSRGGAELAEMSRRARALGKPGALFDIVNDLATLVAA